MMHPQTQPTTPSTPIQAPAWEPSLAADGIDETPMTHSDYNLHPLLVHGLEHYVISAGEDERFFVR